MPLPGVCCKASAAATGAWLHICPAGRYTTSVGLGERIVIDPAVRGGKPCVRGTRITVYDVLEYLAGGMTEAQVLADFPALAAEDLRACLAFAAARERRLAG